jgi:cardiolipin synthase
LLLRSGVKVYCQPAPFAHTKLVLIDNLYTCLGSANLDPRSLSLNYELNMEVFCPELNRRLTRYANALIMRSHNVQAEELQNQALLLRLRDALFWIFSPYM